MADPPQRPRLPVFFYRSATGNEPVRDWLRALGAAERRTIGIDLLRVQEQWPVGMPVCRSLGGGLWEVRSDLPDRRTARVMLFADGDRIGVLHGFIKKTRRTPDADLDLARKRMKEMKR